MSLPTRVTLCDVGPRDGLQNEKQLVDTAVKVELIHRLQAAGIRRLEATSFVSPKWVPQMGDNTAVMAALQRRPEVAVAVLVPNAKGMEAALPTRPDEIVVFNAASEAFAQKNINCSIAESIERFAPVVAQAKAARIKVRAALSCALGCPYEGDIAPEKVGAVAAQLRAIGVDHIGVSDTIGVGTPRRVQAALEQALKHFPLEEVSGHYHDTYGQALANVYASLEVGVSTFDASVGGLGGCPYAKGATGNVATEDVVFMLNGLGIETGVDLDALVDAAAFISNALGRPPVSRVARAVLAKRGV
ncbi:MAG: hydroxymethylglutaryl-CoA lyase [Inhella sp.]|jgi:hydroxymethylglutaryl-CoA lyase|uniref:hydroxymethylglutaryl-CoA lyase n=1 Tax=Inhella sp. TaxID=1921806 RepID=UPI0022CBF020|nr:hydroxymethylglutaryl-CoA lyase [Inhella sp.]MCZ8235348.1 hydroxymethylglutaryl-CoA lyase [Inhella sp.]